jgi:hypothetical protein
MPSIETSSSLMARSECTATSRVRPWRRIRRGARGSASYDAAAAAAT